MFMYVTEKNNIQVALISIQRRETSSSELLRLQAESARMTISVSDLQRYHIVQLRNESTDQ